jgi:two-component system cell cycle response regulator
MASIKTRGRGLKVLAVVLSLGIAAHAAHAVFDLGGSGADRFFDVYLYLGLLTAAALVSAARVVWVRAERAAWACMTTALVVEAIGFMLFTTVLAEPGGEPPFPSIADIFFLAFYPAAYVGLVLLARGRMRKIEFGIWLDGAIVGLTLAALTAALIFQPIVDATSGSPMTVATTLAYPVGDLALLVFIAVICTATGFRPGRALTLIGLGLMLGVVTDSVYAYLASAGSYPEGSLLDTLYPAGAVLTGFAAWQGKARKQTARKATGESVAVFAASALFTMVALALVIFDHYVRLTPLALWLASAAILVGVVRAVSTHVAKLRALRRAEGQALSDGLTEIGNRRRLMLDLEAAFQPGRTAPCTLAFYDLNGFKHYNDLYGHSAGDALLVRLARALTAAVPEHGRPYRLGGDEFCVLLEGDVTGDERLLSRMTTALSESGDGFNVTCSSGVVATPREATSPEQALQLADKRMYEEKGMGRRTAAHQARDVLMQTLLEQEPELHEHLLGVSQRAAAVARSLGLDAEAVDEVRRGAQLHDVGKIAIPARILHKPGPLDPAEWEFMRQHTIIGERIVNAAPALAPVARIVRLSHERHDGSGYPDQLSGDDIPIGASIVGVCDAYDAMTSDRAYREGMTSQKALAEIRRCSGTQFNPVVSDAFLTIIEAEQEQHRVESIAAAAA